MAKNKWNIKKLAALILALSILLTPIRPIAESGYDLEYFIQILDLVQQNYVYELGEEELLQGPSKAYLTLWMKIANTILKRNSKT